MVWDMHLEGVKFLLRFFAKDFNFYLCTATLRHDFMFCDQIRLHIVIVVVGQNLSINLMPCMAGEVAHIPINIKPGTRPVNGCIWTHSLHTHWVQSVWRHCLTTSSGCLSCIWVQKGCNCITDKEQTLNHISAVRHIVHCLPGLVWLLVHSIVSLVPRLPAYYLWI